MSRASFILGMFAALASVASAEAPAATKSGDEIPKFHRVYIPSEQIQQGSWTEGYFPVEVDEFKRLFELAEAGTTGAPNGRPAHVEQVDLSAHVVNDDLLVGKGTFRWARMSPSASLVVMEPFNLAVRNAIAEDTVKSTAARIRFTGGATASPRTGTTRTGTGDDRLRRLATLLLRHRRDDP